MVKNKSLNRAHEIMDFFVDSLIVELVDNIESIVLVGSLSNGSYIAGPGRDIDLITILKNDASKKIFNKVMEHIEFVENKFMGDILLQKHII